MFINKEEELKQIQQKLVKIVFIDALGTILVGLGLYGIFGANGNAFIKVLNNQNFAYGIIVVGGAIMAWALFKIVVLIKRKMELMNENYT